MAETRSKRTKELGETEDTQDGGTMTELLRFFMDEKREEKQRQEIRDRQFLQIIEAMTTKGQDEEKRREELRRAEARERDERLSEERRVFAERLQKEEEEKRAWLEQHEKEKREWFEQIKSSLPNGDSASSETGEHGKPREARLQKLTETDDIEHFLTMFERVANAYKWPDDVWVLKLAPLLTGKAQAAYANMDSAKSKEFKEVKQAILKRYNINEETYRQRFRNTKKKPDESYVETEVRLRDLSTKWLKPKERSTQELADVIIREQLVNAMPKELQLRVRERKPKTAEEAATLADDIISARDGIFSGNNDIRKCLNCGKPGHLARDCRYFPRKDASGTGETRDDHKRSEVPSKRETYLTCYNCGKVGHIASKCPLPRAKASGRKSGGSYFCDTARNSSKAASLSNVKSREGEYMCQGLVEGKPAELLVDSGASCTLVHQALVAQEKIKTDDQLHIKCAHGDSALYPTANIEININGKLYHVRAGVSPTLPRPVLLGRDIGNLLELAVQEQEAYAVLTRIQRRKKEKEEAAALAKEITSGVRPKQLMVETDEENKEQATLYQFDDSIFEGGQKQRKTKKQKREAKTLYQSNRKQTDILELVDDSCAADTNSIGRIEHKDETRDKTGSTRSQEDKNQEDQVQSTATILNMDRKEFQKLQENDPTLESIRKLITEDTTTGNAGKFFKREGLKIGRAHV